MNKENPNCWEIMGCSDRSNCPAYPDQGRACYSVAGTLCRGEKQGTYLEKIKACQSVCKFYPMLNHA